MNLARWNDDRLDDMHRIVEATDTRLDRLTQLVDSHELSMQNIAKYGDRRSDRRFQLTLAAATWVLAVAAILSTIIR
jgi:hypothetical protein